MDRMTLTDGERTQLHEIIARGTSKARVLTRARILLKSADGWSIHAITQAMEVCAATVSNVRRRFTTGGMSAVITDKAQEHRRSALAGLEVAHLIAIATTPAPHGHDHWTIRLLADKAVELGYVTHISLRTVHRLLKKTT